MSHISPTLGDVVAAVKELPEAPTCDAAGEIRVSPGTVAIKVNAARIAHKRPGAHKRGAITQWTDKSRRNLPRAIAQLDTSEFSDRLAQGWFVVMLTLTYPAAWQVLVPGGSYAARHLKSFRARLERATGKPALAFWKREIQRRDAPHFHILVALPRSIAGEAITEWVSRTWAEVVASNDHRHRLAGTGIDWSHSSSGFDPIRTVRYFTNYAGKHGSKEYQNRAPALWIEAGDVGRFWGVWGLRRAERSVRLSKQDLVYVRRILRGLDRSRRRTRIVVVQRVRRSNGRIYMRRVRRRLVLAHLASGRVTGGLVFTNNGPAITKILAKCLRQDVTGR